MNGRLRCNGDEQLTRAWYKFNYLDGNNAPWTPDASLELANGRVVFAIQGDYPEPSGTRWPSMDTGFEALQGVWAARVRFTDIRNGGNRIQSFWTGNTIGTRDPAPAPGRGPSDTSEMDWEWSNHFEYSTPDTTMLYAANHNLGSVYGLPMDCHYYTSEAGPVLAPYCLNPNASSAESFIVGEVEPPTAPGKPPNSEFWTLMMRHYPDRVEYGGIDAGYRGAGGGAWVGSVNYGEPWVNTQSVPTSPQHARFGIYPKAPLTSVNDVFEVDWVYYSPASQLLSMSFFDALLAVEQEVSIFREAGQSRMNSTSIDTAYPPDEAARDDSPS